MKIVNPHLAQNIKDHEMIVSPNNLGYLLLASEIEKPFIFKPHRRKKKLPIRKLKNFTENNIVAMPILYKLA